MDSINKPVGKDTEAEYWTAMPVKQDVEQKDQEQKLVMNINEVNMDNEVKMDMQNLLETKKNKEMVKKEDADEEQEIDHEIQMDLGMDIEMELQSLIESNNEIKV